jgi:alkanesulfonate monooxygenase SsuD/methylene tetrahydromethanopterin reductase-like flavin-dependent oxidoreductase (luciferase family)
VIPIGVVAPPDLPAAEFTGFAADAERHGFDQLWVVEDCFFGGGIAQAAVALAQTSRITIGIGVLPAAARNPAFLALEVATLENLFPGRLIVGVGHGMPAWMRQAGAWPASPVTLLTEYLTALRRLLRGDKVTCAGRYVNLDEVVLETPPGTPPPVLAGVRGPRSLRASAPVSDGAILAEPVTPEYVAAVRSITEPETGGPQRIVAYNVAAVDDSAAVARDRARTGLRAIGDPDWAAHIEPLPFAREFAALRQAAGSREEFAGRIPDQWIDQLAVVGDPAAAAARAAELARTGVTDLVLIPAGGAPRGCLEQLARILPHLRQP